VIQLRDDVLPPVHLEGLDRQSNLAKKDVGSLPLPGDRKFGLVVDQLVGGEEFVITALNEQGFHFNIYTPVVRRDALGEKSTEDQES